MLVSICIPTYNQIKHLKNTIESILNQSFKDYEIIISDDSTSDEVYNLIKEYNDLFSFQYFRHNPSLGSPQNWNYAISKAKGKFIKIMHHDDWFTNSDALLKMIEHTKNHPNSLIFAGIKGDIPKENRSYVNLPSKEVILKIVKDPFELVWGNFIGPPSAILFPNINVKFDKNLIWLVDIEFYINLLISNNLSLRYIPDVFFENIMDDHNITNKCFQNKELELKEFNYIFNKYNSKKSIFERIKFIIKLKKHISVYSKVSWKELIISNLKNSKL
jgi:glycosyltransferase involved in cell wall biosynthesis